MELIAPLADDEVYLNLRYDMTDLLARGPESAIRISALAAFYDYADATGFDVTRAPEITDFHRPETPWDEGWIHIVGVGRERRAV